MACGALTSDVMSRVRLTCNRAHAVSCRPAGPDVWKCVCIWGELGLLSAWVVTQENKFRQPKAGPRRDRTVLACDLNLEILTAYLLSNFH